MLSHNDCSNRYCQITLQVDYMDLYSAIDKLRIIYSNLFLHSIYWSHFLLTLKHLLLKLFLIPAYCSMYHIIYLAFLLFDTTFHFYILHEQLKWTFCYASISTHLVIFVYLKTPSTIMSSVTTKLILAEWMKMVSLLCQNYYLFLAKPPFICSSITP